MMRIITIAAALSMVIVAAAGLVYAYAEPTREAIDKDIAEVRAQIASAEQETKQYQGGVILAQIQLRRAILKNTEAMLDQKRHAFIRFINLTFVVEGQVVAPAADDELGKISGDIKSAQADLARSEAQAATGAGGLVGALGQVGIATGRTNIALLHMKYYTAKYGIPLLKLDAASDAPKGPPGNAVKDKDAL